MSKFAAAITATAMAFFDVAPSCKAIKLDRCDTYGRTHSFEIREDVTSPIGLRMYVYRTGVGGEVNEPITKCSLVPHESYELVTCPGAEPAAPGEHFPGCGQVFCIRPISYPPQLRMELEIPETGCTEPDSIASEEIALGAPP